MTIHWGILWSTVLWTLKRAGVVGLQVLAAVAAGATALALVWSGGLVGFLMADLQDNDWLTAGAVIGTYIIVAFVVLLGFQGVKHYNEEVRYR